MSVSEQPDEGTDETTRREEVEAAVRSVLKDDDELRRSIVREEIQDFAVTSLEKAKGAKPSRRDVLKMGSAAIFSTGLYALTSERVQAATTGEMGESGSPLTRVFTANLSGDGSPITIEDKIDGGGSGITVADDGFIEDGNGLVVGDTAKQTTSDTPDTQILGTGESDTQMLMGRWSANTSRPELKIFKSRAGSIGGNAAVQSGDFVGSIFFEADDGSAYDNQVATIDAVVDGAVGTDDTPGRLQFSTTADGARIATEALRINSSQQILATDGAAGTPALGFINDTDTGIHRAGADILDINTGGVGVARFNSAQQLSLLGNSIIQVGGTTDASSGDIRLVNGGPGIQWRDSADSANWKLQFTSNDFFYIGADAAGNNSGWGLIQGTVEDSNIATTDLFTSTIAFADDDSANDLVVYVNDNGGSTGTINLGSYSTRRMKAEIKRFSLQKDPLEIRAKTFRKGNGSDHKRLGFIAEDWAEAGLNWAVEYKPKGKQWGEWPNRAYREKYGIQREYAGEVQTHIPDGIHNEAILAYHHEVIREQQERIERLERRLLN